MCRLLGLIANKPVDLEFSLERFKGYARNNPDGWGIGWYENNNAQIFKQGMPAVAQESKLPVLSKEIRSKVIVAHVRKGTGAEPAERNSHPFKHESWLFAHNGSVDRNFLWQHLKDKFRKEVKGETDSEVYFYWIIQNIKEHENIIEGIKNAINKVVTKRYTGLNFLLTNGSSLYALRYCSPSSSEVYYSLYGLKRSPSDFGLFEHQSEETRALLRSKSLKGEEAILICSENLTEKEEGWKSISLGSLFIVNNNLDISEVKIL